jgi:glycosyltransferase involved in cell wall biosynthesis
MIYLLYSINCIILLVSKIVIDGRELRTSSGRYVERLLHYLQQLDTENNYQILLKPEDIADWRIEAPNFSAVACPFKEFTFDEQLGLKGQIDSLNADLVHFAFAQQPILYSGKKVTTIHDLTTLRFKNPDKKRTVYATKQRVYRFVIKRAARTSLAIFTPTNYVKSDVLALTHVPESKITVTYEAADRIIAPPSPVSNLQKNNFIMYIGRPTPHKNLERLLAAFEELRAQHPTLALVLAGKKDANYRRIELGISAKLRPHVYFTDFVSEGQLRWLYENCAAYIFPSLSEGFGLPGLEAMLHGAPVVSSNATCLPEVYGSAAHYFDPLDIRAMADAINEVLTDKILRQKLIQAGEQRASEYSWNKMAEQTLSVYRQVLT